MKFSDMINKDPRGKDNNSNNSSSNINASYKRTINILLFVLFSFFLLCAYLIRTSFGIANKNVEIQKVMVIMNYISSLLLLSLLLLLLLMMKGIRYITKREC